ncbi:MAG: hypothetical protein JWP52_1690, partial [Rhizobacter sp.]|nr:hypothetical protein [Rhizobacter sp.]
LLRRPYERMYGWLYAELAAQGYANIRPAFSAVLRNLPQTGARVSELAARASMTKQSMAYLVNQMVDAGLVTVTPDANDKRASNVALTPHGEEVMAAAIALSKSYEARLGELLGDKKMAQLRAVLTELYTKLEDVDVMASSKG